MRRLFALISLCLAFFSTSAQSTVFENFEWDGRTRSYRLRIPPAASSGELLPLIINLHGFAGSASQQESSTDMNEVADTAGFFVAYPNGTNRFLFMKGWVTELNEPAVDDIGFISKLIDTLIASYPIDPAKVYACGFSNGGGMTTTLACAIPDKIRAFGINAALIEKHNTVFCNPSIVRPMLSFHGTADFVVPYNGGLTSAAIEGFFGFWIDKDNCGSAVIENLPDVAPSDGTTIQRARFENCSSGNTYWFYKIVGGTHEWPGSGGGTKDIDADVELWKFFRQHGAAARTSQTTEENDDILMTPNPASGYSLLQGLKGEWTAEIMDISGQKLASYRGKDASTRLDCTKLQTGLYIVRVNDDNGLRGYMLSVLGW